MELKYEEKIDLKFSSALIIIVYFVYNIYCHISLFIHNLLKSLKLAYKTANIN